MHRLMIVDTNGILSNAIKERLSGELVIDICNRSDKMMEKIVAFDPDILMMNISFPRIYGLQVLQSLCSTCTPAKVITLSTYYDEYTMLRLTQMGVFSMILTPCTIDHAVSKIRDAKFSLMHPNEQDWCLENEIDRLLMDLGFHMGSNRYTCIFEAIRIRFYNMECSMKELYIDVAKSCGGDFRRVEKAIRDAVSDAFVASDKELWAGYFPVNRKRDKPYPGNEEFIARAAGYLICKTRLRKPHLRTEEEELCPK